MHQYASDWENPNHNFVTRRENRQNKIIEISTSITDKNISSWIEKMVGYMKASVEEKEGNACKALIQDLATNKPELILHHIDRIGEVEKSLLPNAFLGLSKSVGVDACLAKFDELVQKGTYLPELALLMDQPKIYSDKRLSELFEKTIEIKDIAGCSEVLSVAQGIYRNTKNPVVKSICLECINFLYREAPKPWFESSWGAWLSNPLILDLEHSQAITVLETLSDLPKIPDNAEYILAGIAYSHPKLVLDWISQRILRFTDENGFLKSGALPYSFHQLPQTLSSYPKEVLEASLYWFEISRQTFQFYGADIVRQCFPNPENEVAEFIFALCKSGDEKSIKYSLSLLSEYQGSVEVFAIVRKLLPYIPQGSDLEKQADYVLDQSGTVYGAFGFEELYSARIQTLQGWRDDENENVQIYADRLIKQFEGSRGSESRFAREQMAMQRLKYDEDLGPIGQ